MNSLPLSFFRSTVLPALIVLLFALALFAVSARIWLPGDMLARLIYGGRLSLLIGILPVVLAFIIGTSLGPVAGYVGGKINTAVMRTVDVFYAFPSVLLAIAISIQS